MSDEDKKLEIEDIKGPEPEDELDLDEAVSEGDVTEEEKISETETGPEKESPLEPDPKPEPESKMEEEPEPVLERATKITKKTAKKDWKRYAIIGLVVALVAAAAVLGVMYYLQQKNKQTDVADDGTVNEETIQDDGTTEEESTETAAESLYVNSEVGLNLRATPDTKAAILIIIPYGTKITVLEKQTGWVKTTYEGKTGWISADYTQATDPLVYKDTTYGFGLTFKASWAGYKFVEAKNSGSTTVKTYYVCLPTTDKNWDETTVGIPKGYASIFVMGIYTKEEWAKLAGGEMLPAKLGEGDKYVYTYLPGQAHATDLATQYGEIKDIIKTFETL
jgi:uncharacterized protein YgiM (DUF1202 family)